jgi:hypothetical protein
MLIENLTEDWTSVSKKRPHITKTLGPEKKIWYHSDYVLCYYKHLMHHGVGPSDTAYRILRFEIYDYKRDSQNRKKSAWYCPISKIHVDAPDFWKPIIE